MSEKFSAIDFTEEIYSVIEDIFVAEIICGVTDIAVRFVSGQKFKITIEEI
ncbi:MAG: hypothetical protein K2H30_01610 [Clostridia bacterium]|nr:hypothetical protein [Clostridia bacterium]